MCLASINAPVWSYINDQKPHGSDNKNIFQNVEHLERPNKLYKEVPKSKETRVIYIWLLDNKTYRLVLPRPLTFDPAGVRVVHRYGVQSVTVRVIISTVYRIDYFNDFVLYSSVTCMHDHSNQYGIT